ncbi:hypothetical protein ACFXP7_00955 [Microbacterium sp. P06]|uniref:hypothetical protein n=1 Tax=unclassified Microbacterium TaxID=2609290 RepID=UPI00374694E1
MSAPPGEVNTSEPTVAVVPSKGSEQPRVRRSRVHRMLRLAAADLFRAPRGAVAKIERGAFRKIVLLWAVARSTSLAFLWAAYEIARSLGWTHGPDGQRIGTFLDFITEWDADRYGQISTEGYPISLPMNVQGDIMPNNWAFLPVFPSLERVFAPLVGGSWQFAGVGISILATLGATWVLYLLMRRTTTPKAAWWATVFFSFAPLSFVFVLGYAESLLMLLIFTALLLAHQRRYLLIAPIGVIAAFTRPGALAIALALGILFLVRFFRRRVDPFPRIQVIGILVAGLLSATAGLLWPVIAQAVTGTRNAYIRTETGWWLQSVGNDEFIPMTPWFRQAGTHLGIIGIILVIALMIGFAMLLWSRPVRRLGIVVVSFALSYGLYLFAVFLPQQSTFRLMVPLSPLLGDERLSSTRRRRTGILIGCIVLQAVAVWTLWTVNHP